MTTQPTPPSAKLNLRGAVDLGALAARNTRREEVARRAAADPDAVAQGSPFVVDVTEETFAELVQSSVPGPPGPGPVGRGLRHRRRRVAGPRRRVRGCLPARPHRRPGRAGSGPVARAVVAGQGPIVAAAIVKGQPIPLFTGSYPTAEEIRPVLEEVLRVAEANGVTGRVEGRRDGGGGRARRAAGPAAARRGPRRRRGRRLRRRDRRLDEGPGPGPPRRRGDRGPGPGRCPAPRRRRGPRPGAGRRRRRPDDVQAQIVVADLDLVGATSRTRSPACSASCSAPWGRTATRPAPTSSTSSPSSGRPTRAS